MLRRWRVFQRPPIDVSSVSSAEQASSIFGQVKNGDYLRQKGINGEWRRQCKYLAIVSPYILEAIFPRVEI